MAWIVTGEAEPAPWEEKDASGWDWQIRRDDEMRSIRVVVTGQARDSAGRGSHAEAAETIETKGRSAIDSILDLHDPPSRITYTSAGREDTGAE